MKTRFSPACAFLLAAVFLFLPFYTKAQEFPSVEPVFDSGTFLSQKEENGELNGYELFELGLEYGLCPVNQAEGFQVNKSFREFCENLSLMSFISLSEKEKAEKILTLMYEKLLDHYNIKKTTLQDAFTTGEYNCVSSCLIYICAAKIAGLKVKGWKTTGHAFASVEIDGKSYDVETTNPYGFNPGEMKELESRPGMTKYLSVPKKSYANREEASGEVFAGFIAGNICAECIKSSDYSKAVPLGASRLVFLPGYGAENSGKSDDAETVKKPSHLEQLVRTEFDILCRNYINSLQNKNCFEESFEFADKVVIRWGMTEYFQKYYDSLAWNAGIQYSNEGKYEQAESAFENHRINLSKLGYSKLPEIKEYGWQRRIKPFIDRKDFLAAARMCDEGLKQVPESRKLPALKKQCLQNYDITVHNQAAPLFNQRKYEEARKIVEEGLKNNPESPVLNRDLKMLGQ